MKVVGCGNEASSAAEVEGVEGERWIFSFLILLFCVHRVLSLGRKPLLIPVLGWDPPNYFPILVQGFYPSTKFSQTAFGAEILGILSKIGGGRTKQNEGFKC